MSTNLQKILIIFDLPKTLLLTQLGGKNKYLDQRQDLDQFKPDDFMDQYKVFWRGGRQEFLQNFFIKNYNMFDLAVWSCLDREKTNILTKSFFGRHYRNLLFVSATNRQQYEGIQPTYSDQPISIQRDLVQITQKFPQYDLHNIIVVSPMINQLELFQMNDIILTQFCPTALGMKFDNDLALITLIKYLNGIGFLFQRKKIEDVRPALKGKNFAYMSKRIEFHSQQYQEYL